MNFVFVNHMHPATPHVSGMRSWYFARELAKRGHRVVQICEWREGAEPAPFPDQLGRRLQQHDWAEPMLLAIKPEIRALLKFVRARGTSAPLRKFLVMWSYLRHSGMFTDFSQAAQPYLCVLARDFRPNATWGLFGNTDCWLIAQRLSRLAGCPWVADMKDSWEVFIRQPLRGMLARRFRDMSACTSNAEFNAHVLERWFPPKPVVVYSGVDSGFFQPSPSASDSGCFRLTLTGSVHDLSILQRFVAGLRAWLVEGGLSTEKGSLRLEVIYAGASAEKVAPHLMPLESLARVQVKGYVPLFELASLCRSATVNAYIWNSNCFHHKLLELLSCERPVIAFPGETEESRGLAMACGAQLLCPANEDELKATLGRLFEQVGSPVSAHVVSDSFSWQAQARGLEQVLEQATEEFVV